MNEADNDGWSGLHHAAATNNSRLLLTLMKRHADINLKDKNGKVLKEKKKIFFFII